MSAARRASTRALLAYESLPAEWGPVFGAGEPVIEHCGVYRDLGFRSLEGCL